jgi:hypothetical protein
MAAWNIRGQNDNINHFHVAEVVNWSCLRKFWSHKNESDTIYFPYRHDCKMSKKTDNVTETPKDRSAVRPEMTDRLMERDEQLSHWGEWRIDRYQKRAVMTSKLTSIELFTLLRLP